MDSSVNRGFIEHNEATAPESAALLSALKTKFGGIPRPAARMAEAPGLMPAFQEALARFEATSLSAVEREVFVITFAREVGCAFCVRMHSAVLSGLGFARWARLLASGEAVGDGRTDALVAFTKALVRTRGDVDGEVFDAFLAAGLSRRQALELVLGAGAFTMSTWANRLTGA